MELRILETKQAVAVAFSDYFMNLLSSGNIIHVALSGGSTPKVVFNDLVARYKNAPYWKNVHLYWGDERCVPPTDKESNYKMTVEHLLQHVAIPEENIHRMRGEEIPEEEAKHYGTLLSKQLPVVNGIPQFDLVILGMGDDGHTASIFPHEIHLWKAQKNCAVAIHPDSGQLRITLTGRVINAAKEVTFLVTGDSKSEKVKAIVEEGNESYPAALVAPNSGALHWFLDKEAAAALIT